MKRFRMKGMGVLLLVVLATVALVGCDLIGGGGGDIEEDPPAQQEERGTLTVSLSDEINARTLEPAISMDVAGFTITGDGPGDETFSPVVIDDPTITSYEIENLLAGVWTITVTAENEDGTVIGEGTKTTTIAAGDNTVSIDVLPLPGDGEFELTITWPEGSITDPGFDATLTRTGIDTPESITIQVESGASQAVYTDTAIAAGYYSLNVLPKTGEDVIDGSGFTEAVRIVEGEKTQGLYELTPVGDAEITWNTNLQNPYIVEIARNAGTATFTTTVTPAADDYTYEWYINGVKLDGETGSTVTLTDGFVSGSNTLNAIIQKDGIVSSAREIFEAYTISFDANGGSAETDQIVLDGMTATEPSTDPTKDNYSFAGWFADSGLTTPYDFSSTVAGDISLYAKWIELTSYTVTFDSNGGSAVDPQTVYEDDTASEPAEPTKEGYSFAGWYTDAELTSEYDFATAVTGALTLFAKWEVLQDVVVLTFTPPVDSEEDPFSIVLDNGPTNSSNFSMYNLDTSTYNNIPMIAGSLGMSVQGGDSYDSGFLASTTPMDIDTSSGDEPEPVPADPNVTVYTMMQSVILDTNGDITADTEYDMSFYFQITEGDTDIFIDGTPTITFNSVGVKGEYCTGIIEGEAVSNEGTDGFGDDDITYGVYGEFNVLLGVEPEPASGE